MILALLTGLMLAGTATVLGLRALFLPRIGAVRQLEKIEAYGFVRARDEARPDRSLTGALARLAASIGARAAARFPDRFDEAEIRTVLMGAGLYTMPAATFLGYRVLGTIAFSAVFAWWSSSAAVSGGVALLGTLLAAFAGWVVPMTVVRKRAEQRMGRIELDLPELVDLLVVTVEAGLGFSSSMQNAARRFKGPLGDEIRLTLQEQGMGLSMTEALSNMLTRCETPSMRSFVRSVVQGETLGVSIGTIMRNLASEMRKRRRQSAEERAQKAPIKILFPLVFMIFPAMFVVLLFPATYTFLQAFGGT